MIPFARFFAVWNLIIKKWCCFIPSAPRNSTIAVLRAVVNNFSSITTFSSNVLCEFCHILLIYQPKKRKKEGKKKKTNKRVREKVKERGKGRRRRKYISMFRYKSFASTPHWQRYACTIVRKEVKYYAF